ncbi:unnamed protein product [Polarella glacialis]|uniref:AB hydrolase-1 domain-containing protein n=1 Tax=Polarella glacialis TaxID=89957 RepID=A0A813LI64_POLGL|nr:unnamed protein product [Polarella glacialis]
MSGQVWEVIGGKDKGGLLVREGKDLKSSEASERLSTHAFVEELDLRGERLHYKLITGTGPDTGWVSLKLSGRDLLRVVIKGRAGPEASGAEDAATRGATGPIFCAWYSGGFYAKEGEKLLAPLLAAVQAAGIRDTLVLHFPDAYDLGGQGREPWASYVDQLLLEISKVPGGDERPLILFGHSRGAAPAMCVASRLGTRVLKVYVAACGAMKLGEATAWEVLGNEFKKGGDRDLLKWFSSLQPGNLLLHRTAWDTSDAEFAETLRTSKFLSDMLHIMKRQYRDAMYPDPERDFKVIPAPIMAVSPMKDGGSQPEHMNGWGLLTSGGFELAKVDAGHMDCIQPGEGGACEFFEILGKDISRFMS